MSYNAALWTVGSQGSSASAGNSVPTEYASSDWGAPDYADTQQSPILGGTPNGPMSYDMMVAQYLYGSNSAYNAGDTTYSVSTPTNLSTIWDAGGTDTLDGSAIAGESIILDLSLMAENPSSAWLNGANIHSTSNTLIGGGFTTAGNLGSFQAVTIENAIGGGGNDLLIGNAAANELTGGAGNDTLTGGSGSDIFVFNSLTGSDTISDWNTEDTLQFSASVFNAPGVNDIASGSSINANDLLSGMNVTTTSSSGQTFLVDTDSGLLYYDADGASGIAAVQVADLGTNITIDENDIVMIA